MKFIVELQPSGRRFTVGEEDVLLDAALAQGIRMPHGCRAGSCKSCRAKVVSGGIDVTRAFPAPSFMVRMRYQNGYALMCRATATSDLLIEVDEQPHLAPAVIAPATIASMELAASDVAILRLTLEDKAAISFAAGQYVDLLLGDGVRRSYSIARAPSSAGNTELEFHIRHMQGGLFTDPLFAGVETGRRIELEGPLGNFYLRESAKPALMLASGTGYAPIRSILLDTLPRLQDRKVTLYWGARRREDIYRLQEAADLADAYANFDFVPVLSEPDAGEAWTGRTGLVHQAVMADFHDLSGWQVYACGAPAMVDSARRDFTGLRGLAEESFFSDAFISLADLQAAI